MFKLSKIIIILLITSVLFVSKLFANENSVAVFVYHRFGENDYPSTNIRINQFKKHLDELTKTISFQEGIITNSLYDAAIKLGIKPS